MRAGIVDLPFLLAHWGLAPSKSAARRLIEQGAVDLDGMRVPRTARYVEVVEGDLLRVGKREWVRVALPAEAEGVYEVGSEARLPLPACGSNAPQNGCTGQQGTL